MKFVFLVVIMIFLFNIITISAINLPYVQYAQASLSTNPEFLKINDDVKIGNVVFENFRVVDLNDIPIKEPSAYEITFYRFDVHNTGSTDEKFVSVFSQKYEKFDAGTRISNVVEIKANQKTTITYPILTVFPGEHLIDHKIRELTELAPNFSNLFAVNINTRNTESLKQGTIELLELNEMESIKIPYIIEGGEIKNTLFEKEKKSLVMEINVEKQGIVGLSIPTVLINHLEKIANNENDVPWVLFSKSDQFTVVSVLLLQGSNKIEFFPNSSIDDQKIIQSDILIDSQVLTNSEKPFGMLYYQFQAQKCIGKDAKFTITNENGVEIYNAYLPISQISGQFSGDFEMTKKIIPNSWSISVDCEGIVEKNSISKFYHQVIIPNQISIETCDKTNQCFIPSELGIYQNDVVIWTNNDEVSHIIVSGKPKNPSKLFTFNLPPQSSSQHSYYTFSDAGNYSYHCSIYPWMVGSITVNELITSKNNEKDTTFAKQHENIIPKWIKFNAKNWAEGNINDNEFINGIEFLIKEKIIIISIIPKLDDTNETTIPVWIKNTAGWWASDIVSDQEFLYAIEFLINNKIIQI